jgi:hypothetical protein
MGRRFRRLEWTLNKVTSNSILVLKMKKKNKNKMIMIMTIIIIHNKVNIKYTINIYQ